MQPDPGQLQKLVELRAQEEAERVRQRLEQRKAAQDRRRVPKSQGLGSYNISAAGAQSPTHSKDYKLYFVPQSRERVPFESPLVSHGKAHEREYQYSKTLSLRLQQDLAKESENATFYPKISSFARAFQPPCSQEQIDQILLEKRMYRAANDAPVVQLPKPNQRPISERINQSIQQHVQKLREAKLPREQELDQNCTFAPKITSPTRPGRVGFYERLGSEAEAYQRKRAAEIERQRYEKYLRAQEQYLESAMAPVFFYREKPARRKDEGHSDHPQATPFALQQPNAAGSEMNYLLASVQLLEQITSSMYNVDYM